jgi:methionyl-tRNA formyltransferase
MARSYVNGKEIKINKAEIINNAPNYKCREGAVLGKDNKGVYIKTSDNFIRVTEYEYDDVLKVGDRLESK